MGHGRWTSDDWDDYTVRNTRGKTTQQIFNSASMKSDMDPRNITVRESRDSVANPNSTPIILALDVTGSMGIIADHMARDGLGVLVQEILDRKIVSDPHIMVMGVGDVFCDRAPLQVSQFEADIRVAEQLKDIFLEHGGGGNQHESYTMPWYFAANKTEVDCVKHGRKGMLFTFGDEECPPDIRVNQIKRFVGDDIKGDLSTAELLKEVSEKYDVFHVVVEEGDYARRSRDKVYASWEKVLPIGNIIPLTDYKKMPEVIVSVMQVHAGMDPKDVLASWQGPTAKVVKEAIKDVTAKKPANANLPAANPIKFKFKT